MRHPVICSPEALKARLTGLAREIQPRQHLTPFRRNAARDGCGPESVDAAMTGLYKTVNGGGRNPAAAVL
jgi:hypothetical protein